MKGKLRLSLQTRRDIAGYLFMSPFIIGFIAVYLVPFIESIIFSLSELVITRTGYELNYVGLENYEYALTVHPDFVRVFTETTMRMISDVPFVLAFSFFVAMILNEKFRGRALFRTIFFLPVILGAGIVLQLEERDFMTRLLGLSPDDFDGAAQAARGFIGQMQLPEDFISFISDGAARIKDIVRASGVQILIFLAGLQSVPTSLYEVARVEGATAWESFWKVTLPLMSPLVLTTIVYTVIDTFTAPYNEINDLITSTAFGGAGYGASTAMAWLYLGAVALFLVITIGLLSRWVFYQD